MIWKHCRENDGTVCDETDRNEDGQEGEEMGRLRVEETGEDARGHDRRRRLLWLLLFEQAGADKSLPRKTHLFANFCNFSRVGVGIFESFFGVTVTFWAGRWCPSNRF